LGRTPAANTMTSAERQLEDALVEKLRGLKYGHRADIRDRAALERNFRRKFEGLSRVRLTDGEFHRLLNEAAKQLRINPDNSHHRYGVLLLISGVPVVQVELKTLDIVPRLPIEQIIDCEEATSGVWTPEDRLPERRSLAHLKLGTVPESAPVPFLDPGGKWTRSTFERR
jgi:hypothetical protein